MGEGGTARRLSHRPDQAEIQALFLTRPARLLADLGWLAARRDAESARQRIYVDAAGWSRSEEDISSLSVLQEAIWQERQVQLTYRRGHGTTIERRVDPLELVAAVEGELRTYQRRDETLAARSEARTNA